MAHFEFIGRHSTIQNSQVRLAYKSHDKDNYQTQP